MPTYQAPEWISAADGHQYTLAVPGKPVPDQPGVMTVDLYIRQGEEREAADYYYLRDLTPAGVPATFRRSPWPIGM